MRGLALLLAGASLFADAPAVAQVVYAPMSPADVAQTLQTLGLIPTPCPSGTPATAGAGCYLAPAAVQVGRTTTDANAHFNLSWKQPFATATPFAIAVPVDAQTQPLQCRVSVADQVHVEGDCYQAARQTVQGVAIGASAVATSALVSTGSGVDVRVAARDLTQ